MFKFYEKIDIYKKGVILKKISGKILGKKGCLFIGGYIYNKKHI